MRPFSRGASLSYTHSLVTEHASSKYVHVDAVSQEFQCDWLQQVLWRDSDKHEVLRVSNAADEHVDLPESKDPFEAADHEVLDGESLVGSPYIFTTLRPGMENAEAS